MRKFHPASIKALSNPLTKRVMGVERLLAQENARDRQADTLEDLTADLGEMGAGTDSEGPELVVNGGFDTGDNTGWSGSTGTWTWTGGKAVGASGAALLSDRYPVNPGALILARIDAGQNYSGAPVVRFYDDPTAGNMLSEDALISEPDSILIGSGVGAAVGTRYSRILRAPAGAVSAEIAGGAGQYDNASLHEVSFASRMTLDPFPQISYDGMDTRMAGGVFQLPRPPLPVVTGTFDANASRYWYCLTLVDAAGGETPPGEAHTNRITGTRTLVLPVPPWAHRAVRIYRCIRTNNQLDPPDYSSYELIGEVAPDVYSFADNGLSAIGGAPPVENTTSLRPALPMGVVQGVGSMRSSGLTWTTSASQIGGEYWRTDGAQGNWMAMYPAALDTGRYRVALVGVRDNASGIATVVMDGRLIGSVDLYAASTGYNYSNALSFVVTEPGMHQVVIVSYSRNASSSGYRIGLTEVRIAPVGR